MAYFSPKRGTRMKPIMVCLLLLLLAACGSVGDTTPTVPAQPLADTEGDVNAQPSPVAFEVSETEVVPTPAAAADVSAEAVETLDVESIAPGGFQITVSGSRESTFDSSTVLGVAEYVPESGTLNFQLGDDASATPAEQVTLSLLADLQPGTVAITGDYGVAHEDGTAGAIYDSGAGDTNALFGTNASGAVTITGADDTTISGYFAFTARNTGGAEVVVRGVFNQIEKNPTSD
jgi:hypothetical protein